MTLPTNLTCPDYPLTIGKIENSPNESNAGFCVTNLQFYDVALPEEFIEKNHGVTKLEEVKNEYWDHLIGYWPCDREGLGKSYLEECFAICRFICRKI